MSFQCSLGEGGQEDAGDDVGDYRNMQHAYVTKEKTIVGDLIGRRILFIMTSSPLTGAVQSWWTGLEILPSRGGAMSWTRRRGLEKSD